MNNIVLALGANCGNELRILKRVIDLLPLYSKITSFIYKSKALLPENAPSSWQSPFFNMAIIGYSDLELNQFFNMIKNLEIAMGRSNKARWSPRVIDIDILLWGNSKVESKILSIPHLQMHHRDFVLLPTCDICSRFIHPTLNKSIADIAANLKEINLIKI
ncbi:MAG: 2-amino-4-hydroxy-6-hydroxymethyldihydropteridine diphosphokinase [Candidatus Mesenet longicola]|uniref:2-amino-4-hydroxy-6-hydroxymethyldihydropteridine pyrophosphokinase n=1 Tax=Candidatus Mesenet longicola TaxID=1892558 RepID=A0A8J3HQ07_9RICK|nr:MAG: 2-amino-4-hydroxy-6-hydroxymethyldihydropteridine diphosphokinase [Candidatus Mesenet longicola]GHM59503.1 MAG: 2-amino-4-hydroxy-6-hydroxymethyldihydropteridine diphosphokinase [Candidatus Mesenet longicola]